MAPSVSGQAISTEAAPDVDSSKESFWSMHSKPRHATYSTALPAQHQGIMHHHWELPQSPFHWHSNHHVHRAFNVPDADIRETKTAYYFDVELPGVGDKKSITIRWTSRHSFLVEGLIGRSEVESAQEPTPSIDEKGYLHKSTSIKQEGNGHESSQVRKGPAFVSYTNGISIEKDERVAQPWHDLVIRNERRIGAFSRSFSVCCDVENADLRAKLQDGLLSISLPKSKHEHGLDWRPDIE